MAGISEKGEKPGLRGKYRTGRDGFRGLLDQPAIAGIKSQFDPGIFKRLVFDAAEHLHARRHKSGRIGNDQTATGHIILAKSGQKIVVRADQVDKTDRPVGHQGQSFGLDQFMQGKIEIAEKKQPFFSGFQA